MSIFNSTEVNTIIESLLGRRPQPKEHVEVWLGWDESVSVAEQSTIIHNISRFIHTSRAIKPNLFDDQLVTSLLAGFSEIMTTSKYKARVYAFITENILKRNVSLNFQELYGSYSYSIDDVMAKVDSAETDIKGKLDLLITLCSALRKNQPTLQLLVTESTKTDDWKGLQTSFRDLLQTPEKERHVLYILLQLFYALHVMHEYKIIHGNLNTGNIFVRKLPHRVKLRFNISGTEKPVEMVTEYIVKIANFDTCFIQALGTTNQVFPVERGIEFDSSEDLISVLRVLEKFTTELDKFKPLIEPFDIKLSTINHIPAEKSFKIEISESPFRRLLPINRRDSVAPFGVYYLAPVIKLENRTIKPRYIREYGDAFLEKVESVVIFLPTISSKDHAKKYMYCLLSTGTGIPVVLKTKPIDYFKNPKWRLLFENDIIKTDLAFGKFNSIHDLKIKPITYIPGNNLNEFICASMGDKGIDKLVKALSTNTTLRSLTMPVKNKQIILDRFACALQRNQTLIDLTLIGIPFHNLKSIDAKLTKNANLHQKN